MFTTSQPSPTERPNERATLTVEEAGRALGIGRGLAYDAARRGDIPTLRIGRRLVVPAAAFERMLAAGVPPTHDDRSAA